MVSMADRWEGWEWRRARRECRKGRRFVGSGEVAGGYRAGERRVGIMRRWMVEGEALARDVLREFSMGG